MKRRHAVILLLVLASRQPAPSRADDDLTCLERTAQQVVQWDREWQMDKDDHGVRYRVVAISTSHPRNGPRGYELHLQALGPAHQPKRVAVITKDLAAELFCGRVEWGDYRDRNLTIAVPPRSSSVPLKEMEEIYPAVDTTPADFPFRKLVDGRWTVAHAPADQALFVCATGSATFTCTRDDSLLVAGDMKRVGRAAKAPKKLALPNEFLKHTEDGWQREAPVGLGPDQTVSICSVGAIEFSCLSEEKRQFGGELKELERLAELEQRVSPPLGARPKPKAAETKRDRRRS